jgi:60 kDa SS-A/Ro ribonucleoprotein
MANKRLFKSISGPALQAADAINMEGAPAYALSPRHALAQYAATGCLNSTFYADAGEQLKKVLDLCREVEPLFIAKTALYCREKGFMKDMPALLCAVLSVRDRILLEKVFPRVIDNGKMLRNFVQIMRSGVAGRKSLGSMPKRLIREWLARRSDEELFRASVGSDPSLADIVKMVHPRPSAKGREALYGYLIGRMVPFEELPELVKRYELFKAGERGIVPDVPFQMLTSLGLGRREWTEIAKCASWQTTRMNLNAYARHGVFGEVHEKGMARKLTDRLFNSGKGEMEVRSDVLGQEMAGLIAGRLSDPENVRRARVFPYQLMAAYMSAGELVPVEIKSALQDAMETAIENVPAIAGKVYIFPDVSGSMSSPVTGYRKGSSSSVRCIDVAALVAAAIMRKNPDATVLLFEQRVVRVNLNPKDSVMTNAERLSKIGGGGTNCSAPLAVLNRQKATGDLLIYVSDNQSWVDASAYATETMRQWNEFKSRNPRAKMVCVDIQSYGSTQAKEKKDVLNIGGFSDEVFSIIETFAKGELNSEHWGGLIEGMEL